jgi:predicted DNA-binding transcriptional regulator YafY
MAQNKNALLRYRTIDRCLRNTGRKWTLQNLVDACSDALYEYEGKDDLVSTRTVQLDLQMMRSDKLGYCAPIEVYERKYYRYSDPDYSIASRPLSQHDVEMLSRTAELLRQFDEFDRNHEMADIVNRLQDKAGSAARRLPIVDYERNPNLKGLEHLTGLYDLIASRSCVRIGYRSFRSRSTRIYILHPYLLKEYNNRWFLFGALEGRMEIYNLALDRIVYFERCTEVRFKESPGFDTSYFDDIVGVTRTNAPVERVVLHAVNSQASYILTKPLHRSQTLLAKDHRDGSMTFELRVIVNHEFTARLLSFGPGVKVVEPESLAQRMLEIHKACMEQYQNLQPL